MAIVKQTKHTESDTIFISRRKLVQTLTILPTLIFLLSGLAYGIGEALTPTTPIQPASPLAEPPSQASYPLTGATLNPNLFSVQLPPPPLDALPYEVRSPLSNGDSVPVKKRWLWLPEGTSIAVNNTPDGDLVVDIPIGAIWWKEFYLEHDRSTFLIERRIIRRVQQNTLYPDGWAYYSAHYHPETLIEGETLVLASLSADAGRFAFQPTDWLPTQRTSTLEVQFEDERGVTYPYVFPGDLQCVVCHSGASGAYPNQASDPIQVFGLHPNNLTPDSFTALVNRGWLTNGESLLTAPSAETTLRPVDDLTADLVAVMRNNCASCHNASPDAAGSITAFVIDPNRDYSTEELLAVLGVTGQLYADAYPLVTAGDLEHSEVWLRLNGLEGRRRMPPREGGLPHPDESVIALWRDWILATGAVSSESP